MRNKKKNISKKLKEEVWIKHFGEIFSAKCPISWCSHKITVFCFEAGHNIPESKGGRTAIDNLIPICGECNRSMGDRYTITEFSSLHEASKPTPPNTPTVHVVKKQNFFQRLLCFSQKIPAPTPQRRISSRSSVRNLFYK
uniref:HNH domain-containing protein n=1 Tax=viral metagenome TaxID=1070528 RepID=A0A6C0BHL4_9ZZZZ